MQTHKLHITNARDMGVGAVYLPTVARTRRTHYDAM